MGDTVGDCPNCGKRTFVLHPTIIDGHKGLMGNCYSCGHEEFIDQGEIHTSNPQPRPRPSGPDWDAVSKWWGF
jgi:hypothetical protein